MPLGAVLRKKVPKDFQGPLRMVVTGVAVGEKWIRLQEFCYLKIPQNVYEVVEIINTNIDYISLDLIVIAINRIDSKRLCTKDIFIDYYYPTTSKVLLLLYDALKRSSKCIILWEEGRPNGLVTESLLRWRHNTVWMFCTEHGTGNPTFFSLCCLLLSFNHSKSLPSKQLYLSSSDWQILSFDSSNRKWEPRSEKAS